MDNNRPLYALAIGVMGFLILVFMLFVYNNNQNIGRDKYVIDHCNGAVKKESTDNGFTTSYQYKCEAK